VHSRVHPRDPGQVEAFTGENIQEYGITILALAKPLTNAGRYPQELIAAIIKNLLMADGKARHEGQMLFQADVMQFRQAFLKKLESLGLKSDLEKALEMKLKQLDLIVLCGLATMSYSALVQDKSWQQVGQLADM
jgi:hypothetical protein